VPLVSPSFIVAFDQIVKQVVFVVSVLVGSTWSLRESPHEKIKDIHLQLLTAVDPFGAPPSSASVTVNLTTTNEAIEKSDETAWQWGFWPFTVIPRRQPTSLISASGSKVEEKNLREFCMRSFLPASYEIQSCSFTFHSEFL